MSKKGVESIAGIVEKFMDVSSKLAGEYGGYLDKHIGDASLVVFGIKEKVDSDMVRRAMLFINDLNKEMWSSFSLSMSHGVSAGEGLYGVFGDSSSRSSFTVFAECVDQAFDLQSLAKNNTTLVSQGLIDLYSGDNLEFSKTQYEKIYQLHAHKILNKGES